MKQRVSFIEFLNSVPLGWGFLQGSCRNAFDLIFDVPSECARHLANGEADVGLIPVIEYQNIPGLRVLPDISIASKHEVRSVLFVSKLPLERVSRIALDRSSRTSVALLKILLHKFYGRQNLVYCEENPDAERMLAHYDAALLIGNPALQVARDKLYIFDLAEEWNRFTGLPFVFAFWAVREGVDLSDQAELFYRSRSEGLNQVDAIAALYADKLRVTAEEIRHYILCNLNYSLDDANLRGLVTFYQTAAELGLIASPKEIRFYGR